METHGKEGALLRLAYQREANRKNGYEELFRASSGQQEMLANLHKMHEMKSAAPLILQNPDGSFIDYIPGLDGPVNDEHGNPLQ